ncbi:MAG: hypothetical protein Q9223_003119 [Gallowayella weberi]
MINQCITTYLWSYSCSSGTSGRSLQQYTNDDHCTSDAYQSHTQNGAGQSDLVTRGYGTAPLDFDEGRQPYLRKDQAHQPHDDLMVSPLSWPARSLLAGLGTPVSKEALDYPARSPPVSCSSTKQSADTRPRIEQSTSKFDSHSVFRPLEDYIISSLRTCDCLNDSFTFSKPAAPVRSISEGAMNSLPQGPPFSEMQNGDDIFELDAKTLLLGDVAENGAWWLGKPHADLDKMQTVAAAPPESKELGPSAKSLRIDWSQLHDWYEAVLNAGHDYRSYIRKYSDHSRREALLTAETQAKIESDLNESSVHLRRTLLKATETLLRRPGRPLKAPGNCRFLLLLLANPLLYSVHREIHGSRDDAGFNKSKKQVSIGNRHEKQPSPNVGHTSSGCHTGIIKRILGLIANVPQESQRQIVSWFTRYDDEDLRKLVDLVNGFVAHRLIRQGRRPQAGHNNDSTSVLVPEISGPGAGTSAQLHAALGIAVRPASPENLEKKLVYHEDWQIKAAAKVMVLLFQANNSSSSRRQGSSKGKTPAAEQSTFKPYGVPGQVRSPSDNGMSKASLKRARRHGQLLPTSAFYNTVLDYSDLVADFEAWENRRGNLSFCQYPMFLSLWAKIRILEHDARRQMEIRARQAFFNSIMSRSAVSQHLLLKIRRECLVEDSLRGVSEVVGSGQEDIKKSLRIAFQGEEGVDAGGLRKEWFLLLVREVFDPEHGMFVYDEDSQYCYFNPNTFETSDQFFLVGVVLGLAIYNSIILDVALPPFTFRKLLASAPTYTGPLTSMSRPNANYTLADLAEFRPVLASGLQSLLEYDGDVQDTFCRDFVAESHRYGQLVQVPLCPHGESKAVTNDNRAEFVELYVKYLLDTSVSRQFEPFKRGFFSVCGGNALSLFRPEEIELLVRGSDELLDVATLRAVAINDGWKQNGGPEDEVVIAWFWEIFAEARPKKQRALLSFITGSDRLPAMGATSLIIKISCLGDDIRRFPMARTCFNMLGLYWYPSKELLQTKLWAAVTESEGFGLK